MTYTTYYNLTRGLEEYELEVDFRVLSWGDPGCYWYPPEPMEIEIDSITLEAPPWAKRHFEGKPNYGRMPFAVSEKEYEAIELSIYENPPEDDYDD